MNKVELLAPAKNFETAIAAINSGADAIYIGASDFGARYNASNTLESIEQLVNYAHKFYVAVHVTINTILNNNELVDALNLIKKLYSIGVDAIIVQDMGIIKAAIEEKIPPIQIHMSTQCDNRTLSKVKFFDKLGVSRVILARELSLSSVQNICDNVNCEIETFVHGALCVSYSGQCYLSYANGGRSANRGMCAQPCRRKYSLIDGNDNVLISDKYLLSLKDFNASESIEKLILCGVKSFKIEGRLKDQNYVKNVTFFYNNLLNNYARRTSSGVVITDFRPNLCKTFNRSYTDYFLAKRSKCYNLLTPKSMGEFVASVNKVGNNYFEVDNCDIHSQDGIFFLKDDEICGFLVNKVIGNKIFPNQKIDIFAGAKLYRNKDAEFEKYLEKAVFKRKIRINIFINTDNVTAIDEDGNTSSIDIVDGENPINLTKLKETYISQLSKVGDSDFCVENIKFESDNLKFLPISKLNNLRRNLLNSLMNVRLNNYPKKLQKKLSYAEFPAKELDFRANVLNNNAKEFYERCSCKVVEPALESLKNIPSGIELMRCKHCLKYVINKCQQNLGQLYLKDENGKKYPLLFDCKNCEMVVLSP